MSESRKNLFRNIPVLSRLSLTQLVLIGIGLLAGLVMFFLVRGFVLAAPSTFLPGLQVIDGEGPDPSATDPVTGAPIGSAPPGDDLPKWDGSSTFSVLLLGLDYDDENPERTGPSRSDTMILVTVDPIKKTAGMIAIPRDMWVDVPGYGYHKINTAYFLGESNKLPGGGAALAAKTVEQFLGVPVQYYAVVSFDAFVKFVDELGGIDVLPPNHLWIYPMGEEAMYLEEKPYHFNGQQALAYARNRKKGGDVERSERTEQVLLAIRDRVLDPAILPSVVAKAPKLYQELASGLVTNLTYDAGLRMFSLAMDIPTENIRAEVIDYSMMQQGKSPEGLDIYTPIPDEIRPLVDEVLGASSSMEPIAQGADLLDLMKQEGATVSVLNGTYTEGLAARTADYLRSQGVNVVNVGNPDQIGYVSTEITDTRGKPYMVKYLYDLFNIASPSQHTLDYDPASSADVVIILGDDWAFNNPMP
jgi:LCP family protein required for cell wall assembly